MEQEPIHRVLPIPRLEDFIRVDWSDREVFDNWQLALRERREMLEREARDPLRYGYEPEVWKLSDALLGFKCFDLGFEKQLMDRFGLTWEQWCGSVRRKLGFDDVVKVLLIAGTNRSGKTEYMAKRMNQYMALQDDYQVWAYAETSNNSVRILQKAIYKYLSPEYRGAKVKTDTAYINYSTQRGFVDAHFILPETLSECDLRNYAMDLRTAEGGDIDLAWMDELVPLGLMNTIPARVSNRMGRVVVTQTPVLGYTPSVAEFQNSAETVLETDAFLIPIDGGPSNEARAFGFANEAERKVYNADGIVCRPWSVLDWFDGKDEAVAEGGRIFRKVPRVMRCKSSKGSTRATIFFHPMDNPYSRPDALWDEYRHKSIKERLIRMYGLATRSVSNQFPTFERRIHVVPDDKIPKTGTRYHIVDPTPGARPYVWGYFLVTRHGSYLCREFPRVDLDSSEIEIDNFPVGDWAVVSEKKGGVNDGGPGPAYAPIGWGRQNYKRQWATEEGWSDAQTDTDSGKSFDLWDADNGAREVIMTRYMDPAAAEMPNQHDNETTTLLESYEDLGIYFEHAKRGKRIDDRLKAITDMFAYEEKDGEVIRQPALRIAESCKNAIYCVENYLGVDGQKGVMKDFIDILGYFALLNLEFYEESDWDNVGGGHL